VTTLGTQGYVILVLVFVSQKFQAIDVIWTAPVEKFNWVTLVVVGDNDRAKKLFHGIYFML
jgi:hypothetical protein